MKKGIVYLLIACSSALLIGCGQNKKGQVTYESVDTVIADAGQAYESGDYADALNLYADAIKTNPLSVDAQLGAAKCQMARKNYMMASENLSAAARIDPQVPEIYDLYLELADTTKGIYYARAAVNLAKDNHVESFLTRMPEEPELSLEEGEYDSRQELTITAEEGTEIVVTEKNGNDWFSYTYDGSPIRILSGETTVTAYCTKDGVPSDEVSATYQCQYDPTEISFKDRAIEAGVRDALDRDSGPITDLDCEGITYLYCSAYKVRDEQGDDSYTIETLEDLKNFPKLQNLQISDIEIDTDLNALSACRLLNTVSLIHCDLSDISFVRNLPQLSYLSVSNNEGLKDISPAAECEKLSGLEFAGTGVTDLSPLKGKEITQLEFSLSDELNGSTISEWKDSLRGLELSNCGGRDLNWLKDFTNLSYLYLYAAEYNSRYDEDADPLTGLEFLSELKNLNNLYLYGLGDVSSLESVKSLKKLSYLSFNMNDRDKEIPEDLINEIKKSLPKCTISY